MTKELTFVLCVALALACGGPSAEEPASMDDEAMSEEAAAPPRAVGELSAEEIVLAELNETCAENWCYGEFDYEVLSLECGETTCELFFRAERDGEVFEDSVVFEYDQPLVDDGYLESGNWERVNDAISDEWEPAHSAQ